MNGWSSYWRRTDEGLAIRVRLTPGSSREGFDGVGHGSAGESFIRARVRSVPEAGKANRALVKLLASRLGCRKSDIEIIAGVTSRTKTLLVRQPNTETLVLRLDRG